MLCLDTNQSLPKVDYATALDIYITICLLYTIASILQFWGVHYFTKKDSGEIEHDPDSEREDQDDTDEVSTYIVTL